jgi:hypothetical protein
MGHKLATSKAEEFQWYGRVERHWALIVEETALLPM